jgi:hypothetical protein
LQLIAAEGDQNRARPFGEPDRAERRDAEKTDKD